jgi:asparagine synthase (glutamine-hydrolysing)
VSDVPVGVFLSGGIDSASLAGILARGGERTCTFSLVFREAEYSEAEYSQAVAKAFGTQHHELLVSQADALAAIPGALRAMDQPSIDGLNTYLVSQHTRAAGIKVALSGLGGDELFCGYSSFRAVPRMERFAQWWRHVPAVARHPLAGIFSRLAPPTDQNRKLADLARSNGHLLHPYFLSRTLFTPEAREDLVSSYDEQTAALANASQRENLERASTLDPVNRVSYLESRCYMLNTLLRDSDVMSMAHGLEVRVPLIDHVLAGKLIALPGAWKLDPHTPKPMLVGALHGSLPDQIVHRRKRGFTLPFEHWLRDELQGEVETSLHSVADGPLASVLDPKAVRSVWEDFQRGRTSWSRPWSLFVLQRCCELQGLTA